MEFKWHEINDSIFRRYKSLKDDSIIVNDIVAIMNRSTGMVEDLYIKLDTSKRCFAQLNEPGKISASDIECVYPNRDYDYRYYASTFIEK